MEKQEQVERLRKAIRHLHKCDSHHLESVPIKETFRGETVWEGFVEVFSVTNHSRAQKCYAWCDKSNAGDKIVAILEIPPVRCPLDAVKASIVAANKYLSD